MIWVRFGINNIVGYLKYDESIFDDVKIEGTNEWIFEQNQDKNSERYGKFVLYTMKEGTNENQDIAVLTLKLKDNIKPQTTEVKFTKLQSSNGKFSVDEDDRKAIIEIYEEEQIPSIPDEPTIPDVPEEPEKPETPEQPAKPEEPKNNIIFSVKTGDAIIFVLIVLIIATIALNIMVFFKYKKEKQNNKGIKVGIISAISVIVIGLLILGITSFAHNSETMELINKLNYKEHWLNSEKYLVTDENVSRVMPLTNVQDVTDKFNKEIEIYKQDSNQKVTDGLVKSGMMISDKEHKYDVSVLGDINGDGYSDHVDLTNIIRNIVNSEKHKFNGLEKLSADMNFDKVIDQGDVNTSIKYILYGDMDIPTFEKVKEPKIEVVGGAFYDKIDAYENTIQVKITKQDEKAVKTKYKIEGTTTKDYTEVKDGEVIDLPNNGVYKISAYNYGNLGNRSEIPYEILVKKNPNNKYKVITRIEKEDGTYEESVEEKEGRIGNNVAIENEIPDGYELNENESKLTGEISEDKVIELVATYNRKEYTLTLEAGENISSVKMGDESNTTISKKIKFGKSVDISAELKTLAGNDISWKEWKSDNTGVLQNQIVKDTSIKMPKSDIKLTATANRALIEYSINYELNGGKLEEGKSNPEKYSVETPDFALNNPIKKGYKFKGWTGTDLTEENNEGQKVDKLTDTVIIKKGSIGNRSYVANWEVIDYSITYNLNGGNLLEEKTNPEKYTIETPTFTLNNPVKSGYTFIGWTGTDLSKETEKVEIATGSIGDRNYTANWKANTGVTYYVQYYLEKLESADINNKDNYELIEDKELSGTTDEKVTAQIKEYAGFTYSENNPNNILTGTVSADGSLVLKVYYTRNSYTLTLAKDENIESVIGNNVDSETLKGVYKYDEQVKVDATLKEIDGYIITFNEWISSDVNILRNQTNKKSNFKMPASDLILTATSNKTANDVKYVVEYYYQEQGFYKNTTEIKKEKSAKTDTSVEVTDEDKTPTKTGYVIDKSKQNDYTGKVKGDGSLVLKVYFKQQFTVTYKPGTKGTFSEEQTENLDYGAETPSFKGELTHQEGYEFNGWSIVPADRVTENVEYVATWKEKEYNIVYTLNGGDLGTDNDGNKLENPDKYTISTETFTLNNPSKKGYEFKGWTGTDLNSESKNVTIEKGSTGDRAYVANWKVIDYTITYELNGGTLGNDESGNKITNPTKYNVETPTFSLNNPVKTGYTFTGWTGTDLTNETKLAIVENGSTGNRSYEANWETNTNVEYHVQYYLEKLESDDSTNKNNYELKVDETEFGVTDEKVTAEIKNFKGFTYDETNGNNNVTGTVAGDGSLALKVYYTRNSYTLKLEKDENVENVTGKSVEKNIGINVDDSTGQASFKFEQPIQINATLKSEVGYDITFVKWQSNNTDLLDDKFENQVDFEMPAGNLTLKAISNKSANTVDYTVEHYYQVNGEYSNTPDESVTRKAETDVEVFVTDKDKIATKDGYVFDETKNGILSGKVKGDGSLVLKVYFKQQFTVTYKSGDHGVFKYEQDEKTEEKYENLDYNSTTPVLKGILTAQKGYEFINWSKEIAEKVTENAEHVANWNAIKYQITYELNDGSLGTDDSGNAITNPTTYTIETENITLNNPSRVGYKFKGWTGTDLTEQNGEGQTVDKLTDKVIIPKGSIGDRYYIANWEPIEYTITYNLNNGKLLEGVTNPEKYTIETSTFTLNNPVKTGYTFLGWTGTGLTEENSDGQIVDKLTDQVIIEKGSTGNRAYTANWKENTGVAYHVQYYLEKLESTDSSNKDNYNLEQDVELSGTTNEEINADIKEYIGFTYDEHNVNNVITGNIAGDGSLVLKVFYTRNTYTLTLEKDENVDKVTGKSIEQNTGISVDESTGKAIFKYEQPIEIEAIMKSIEGYNVSFKAWESSSEQVLNTKEEKEKQKTTFVMPAEDVTARATSIIEANTVEYSVEYYYESENSYPQTPTYTQTRSAKVGEEVTVTDSDKIPNNEKIGYEFDESADNVLTSTIPTKGTVILKVFFKKSIYILNIVAGEGITEIKLDNKTAQANGTLTGTYKYGDSITIDASYGEENGYTIEFGKWKSNSQKLMEDNTTKNLTFAMPAGDLTLTAVANRIPLDTSYKVEYYYQKDGKYPEVPDDTLTRNGKTGEQVSVTSADKVPITEGYVYDADAEGKIESTGEEGIAPDGSTTLRVYFKQQFTVTYKPGEYGTFDILTIKSIDYGADIPGYTKSVNGNSGYVFDTWKLTKIGDVEVTEDTEVTKVTANLEYTAMWKAMPIPTVTHKPTEWTNQDITVTITKPESEYTIEYTINDNTNWIEYTDEFKIEQNSVIHARLAKETNKGQKVDHEIGNMDKIGPQFTEKTVNTDKNDEATITVKATDNLSGIVEYGITKEGYAGPKTYKCENALDKDLVFNEIYENGIYKMYLKDAAGNISEDTIEITNITGFNVVRIVSAPEGYENLIGTEYETLASALENSDEVAQLGNVKFEIIHNIYNEVNTIENGRDYTINLNNYYVKNQEAKKTFTVNGKLKVLDENSMGKGTIASPFGVGIYISKNGELTLGEDDNSAPSVFSPIVEGLTYGIEKEIDYEAEQVYDTKTEKYYYPEGVLNFYDGKVIGGTASFLIQRVNDTPTVYDTTIATNAETKKQEATLAIVSGIEAVIGKKRYMLLEQAVDDANNVIGDSNTQVEIKIVNDIAKDADHKVVVDNTKNIKLDLNGHVFTTTANDYVLENYGKLEIYDSNAENSSIIEAEQANIVRGNVSNVDNRVVVSNATDLNFNFNVKKENSYILSVIGKNFGKNLVTLDGNEIFNFGDSDSYSQWSTVDIELGELTEGNHTIRCYLSGSGSTPTYDYFEIKEKDKSNTGKITSSTNTAILNGISNEKSGTIEYEDIDLTKSVAKGDYFFETRADGGLISNNAGIGNSTAHSMLEIDLTDKEGIYEVITNAVISSQNGYDIGYISVKKDDSILEYNNTKGRKVTVSGDVDDEYKFDLVGGVKYYIQFSYRKDAGNDLGSDCFIIKNMKIGRKTTIGELIITSGIYECTKQGTNSLAGYTAVIQNESNLYVNGGEIKAINDYYSVGIYDGKSDNFAYSEINGGTIISSYQSILNRGLTKINNGIIYSRNNASIWSDGNLHIQGKDTNITGSIGVSTNNSGNTIINSGNIFGRQVGIYNYNEESTTIINNVKVSSNDTAVENYGSGYIKIENMNIILASKGIYNYTNGTIEINNIEMTSFKSSEVPNVIFGLYNYSNGKIIFNNGNIYSNQSAIQNVGNGTIEMNGGSVKTYGNYTAVVNAYNGSGASGIFKMTNGTITGSANGNVINNKNNGSIIITGGKIESQSTKYPAIYNTNEGGIVTIGTKDDEINTNTPIIKIPGTNAVNNKLGTFNFYDGTLIGEKDNVISGIISEIPENTEIVRETKEDGAEYITLGIPTYYVAKISASENPDVSMLDNSYYKLEDGYYYFITLDSAVKACSKTNESTIELIDNPWIYRTITVDASQNIKIKFNDKIMYLHATLNFDNNGNISFINENTNEEEKTYGNIQANGGLLIKNNQNAEINLNNILINYSSSEGSSQNIRKLIDNYGVLNVTECKYNNGSNLQYAYDVYNENTGILNINNIEISGGVLYPVVNEGKDKISEENTVYSAIIKNSNILRSTSASTYGIINSGDGTMLIETSTINTYHENSNKASGKLIIRDSTLLSQQLYNNKDGEIEIENSTIQYLRNYSNGKIVIKGKDSNLKVITNSNKDGTVEMLDGKVSYNGTAIENYGKLTIYGGTVEGIGNNYSVGIYNRSTGVTTIRGENTTITGSGYGISNEGTAIVESGVIKGTLKYGIYNIKDLILGIKDGTIATKPTVYGKTNGIYNTGTFNFYDGIIEGNESSSITGKIPSETEDDCTRVIYKGEYTFDDGTDEGYNVTSGREISVIEKVNVAYVVSKDKKYSSLNSALADTENTDTIKLIHDVSIAGTMESLTIAEDKNITLDFNGFNIVASNNNTIVNNGTLTIIDSTSHEDDGGNIVEGKFVNGANTILENNGTASVENGSYELTIGGTGSNYYYMFKNAGTLNLNSKGSYVAKGANTKAIYNTAGGVVIRNGIIDSSTSYSSAIWNEAGTISIESGTIKGNEYAIYNLGNSENDKINVNGGTINGKVYNKSSGTINISEGNIGSYVYNENNGIINISGGNIGSYVYNNSSGRINITGGTITSSSNMANTIVNNNTGIINIDGTDLSSENPIRILNNYSNGSTAIRNQSTGTISIKGYVEINSSNSCSNTSCGIYNESTGTINIGDSDEITNNVKVSSRDYGVFNYNGKHGTINYYGGTITANTAVRGYIDEIPNNYYIARSTDDSNKEIYEIKNEVQEIVSVGENKYESLVDAISNNNTGTITLLKDIVLTTSEPYTVSEDKELTIDLNGHTIRLHNWNTFITNYGILKITDNTETQDGRIYGYVNCLINNHGSFEMAGGTIRIEQINNDKIIYNTENGTVSVTGGTLYNKGRVALENYYIVYSNNDSTINVTGGTFSFHGKAGSGGGSMYYSRNYGIYTNNQNATVKLTGGEFNEIKESTGYSVYMNAGGTVNASGNTISTSDYGIYMNDAGTINISENAILDNASYSGCYSIYVNNKDVEININGGEIKAIRGDNWYTTIVNLISGTVTGTISYCGIVDVYNGITLDVTGTALSYCKEVNIHEGSTVKSTSDAIYNCTNVNINNATIIGNIYNPTEKLTITGGSITGKQYGIQLYNKSAVATLTGGSVEATEGPGILITAGTLILGEDDGGYPSTEIPAITGSTYGVKNDGGTFNFYDGVLTGSTYATSGTVTKTPEMFSVIYSTNGTVAILGIEAVFEQVAIVNGVYYNDLSSAIDAAIKVNGKVELCKDITTTDNITIPAGSTVIIDLLGFSINGYTESGALFTNNGTLTIEDSTNEGTNESTVKNYTGIAIINNGTLTIGTNDNTVYDNAPKIIGKTTGIENNGELYFVDGQIGVTDEDGNAIINAGKGYKPDGYKIVKLEGKNIYTLVQE